MLIQVYRFYSLMNIPNLKTTQMFYKFYKTFINLIQFSPTIRRIKTKYQRCIFEKH